MQSCPVQHNPYLLSACVSLLPLLASGCLWFGTMRFTEQRQTAAQEIETTCGNAMKHHYAGLVSVSFPQPPTPQGLSGIYTVEAIITTVSTGTHAHTISCSPLNPSALAAHDRKDTSHLVPGLTTSTIDVEFSDGSRGSI
ncbi:MAG: hypothetical protein ACFWT0_00875 [Bifidobacterium crudilactis]|jgi:hypothetical protein